MRKTTITISFDEEKLSALKMYLEQKKLKVETVVFMYYFWSKCEWEVLISPWVGGNDDEEIKVDVAWQIMNNWDVFVDYTWNNRKKL